MFLNLLGNIFASREANFVSATINVSTGGQTGKHLRKHRESQMFPQKCFLVCPGLKARWIIVISSSGFFVSSMKLLIKRSDSFNTGMHACSAFPRVNHGSCEELSILHRFPIGSYAVICDTADTK
jgi:hypothetical protein